ncbi:hypothetical protein, partial [Archangium sp.]|uniref:hypothetical protein n=1 Tax=Archangium sp. TaxID=1872627 RepID=UPI002D4FC9A9
PLHPQGAQLGRPRQRHSSAPQHQPSPSTGLLFALCVGIQVVLDRWHNASISSDIARFVSTLNESDFIAVVGTRLYRQKYENKLPSTGTIVAAEMDLIHQRLTGTESAKRSVLPLLLDGEKETSLPPLMCGRVHGDFRRESSYFEKLLDLILILTLYGIPFEEPAVIDLRDSLRPSAGELD